MSDTYKSQLQKLLRIPKIEQKTPEWYNARNNLITASDFAQALGEGKFGTQRQLIEKKVCISDEFKPVKNIFFEWGNLFEPVACSVYSYLNGGIRVHEFGLIKHPFHDFFGASPDGITEDGIMLEIKCPFKRKISGEIPLQYYYQIQGQLDVCGLEECDYFECEFAKYTNYEEYAKMYEKGKYTGIIKEGIDKSYTYGPVREVICKPDEVGTIYWVLQKYHMKRVYKDEAFVNAKLTELKTVWDRILFYRQNPDIFQIEIKRKVAFETQLFDMLHANNVGDNVADNVGDKKERKSLFVNLE